MEEPKAVLLLKVSASVALLLIYGATGVLSDASDHRYSQDDPVPLYANKVGPFHNPSETYRYSDQPFCVPDMLMTKRQLMTKKRLAGNIFMVMSSVLALVGVFYPYNRGALFTALVVIYALTSALPFGTILVIVLIWTLVTSPSLVLGGIAGKNSKAEFQAPCRTMKYPREIPPLPWYRSTIPQMAIAGFLPFRAIYVELYYIFASVWGHRNYTIYSILFIVFIILLIVTAFITVALTYFQLAAEDHEWWWRSFLCGGSTGLFMFGYCLYYYHARTNMSGFMQTSFLLMLGSVGFCASLFFVRHIYRSIKCE